MKNREEKLAFDAWIAAMPSDEYDLCPCGCGKKFRFVVRDEKICAEHEKTFIKNWILLNQKHVGGLISLVDGTADEQTKKGSKEHERRNQP